MWTQWHEVLFWVVISSKNRLTFIILSKMWRIWKQIHSRHVFSSAFSLYWQAHWYFNRHKTTTAILQCSVSINISMSTGTLSGKVALTFQFVPSYWIRSSFKRKKLLLWKQFLSFKSMTFLECYDHREANSNSWYRLAEKAISFLSEYDLYESDLIPVKQIAIYIY